MKKYYSILLVINIFFTCFAPDVLEGQLVRLRSLLQQLLMQLEPKASPLAALNSKIDTLITSIAHAKKPLLLIPLLLEQMGERSSKIPKYSGGERTTEEMQSHQEIRADLSDLLEEIDRTKEAETLRGKLVFKLEELYAKLPPEQGPSHEILQEKIASLITTVQTSGYPVEFFRIILEELAELPILPEREEAVPLDPQEEKDIRGQFAVIMKDIVALRDFKTVRENFVQQLKAAYSQAITEARKKEAEEGSEVEEIVITPDIPEEPEREKTAEELEQEEIQRKIKEALEERRKKVEGEYEGDTEEDEEDDAEYFPWD